MRDRRAVAWLFLLPTVLALGWHLLVTVERGGLTSYRLAAFAVGAVIVVWSQRARGGARPGVLGRLVFAAAAVVLFWLSAVEFALGHVTILALGLLFLLGCAAIHFTVLFGLTGSRGEAGPSRLFVRIGLSLSMVIVMLWGIEGLFRVLRPVQLYDIIPDDPAAGSSMELRASGRPVGRPGFRGQFIHPEFPGCRIEFNAWGLRDGLDEASSPAAGERSVVVLGDSMTFGTGVALEEAFHERIEQRAGEITSAPLRVYGAAIPGYSTLEELEMLEELAPKARPDVVVVGVFEGNDFQDSWAAEVEEKGRQELASTISTFERFVRGVFQVRYWATSSATFQALNLELTLVHLGLIDARVHTNLFLDDCLLVEPPPLVGRLRENVVGQLVRMGERCEELGAKLVLLIIPDAIQAVPARFDAFLAIKPTEARESFSRLDFHAGFVAQLKENGLSCVDMLSELERDSVAGEACYFLEGHLNVRGHEVASRLLVPALAKLLK